MTVSDRESFRELYRTVFERVSRYADRVSLPSYRGFYYEDREFARQYAALQTLIVPARKELSRRVVAWAWKYIQERVERDPNRTLYVLDAGTGDGNLLQVLVRWCPREFPLKRLALVGADRSETMLDVAARRLRGIPVTLCGSPLGDLASEQLSLVSAWKERLGTQFDGFDLVMSQQAFHFIPDRRRLYASLASISRPDGAVIVADDFLDAHTLVFAPMETILEGLARYRKASGRGVSLVGFVAGFIFRRSFLQRDALHTLSQERRDAARVYPWWYAETHRRFPEFSILAAAHTPIETPATLRSLFRPAWEATAPISSPPGSS
jgi:SAM-dependent methyltransferase